MLDLCGHSSQEFRALLQGIIGNFKSLIDTSLVLGKLRVAQLKSIELP